MSADRHSPVGTYPAPPHGWTCFHCGVTFPSTPKGERRAREHFGQTPARDPVCIRLPSREAIINHAAELLEREAASLKETHTLANGDWLLADAVDLSARSDYDDMRSTARVLRVLASGIER